MLLNTTDYIHPTCIPLTAHIDTTYNFQYYKLSVTGAGGGSKIVTILSTEIPEYITWLRMYSHAERRRGHGITWPNVPQIYRQCLYRMGLPQDFIQNWSTKNDLPQDFSQNWSNKNDLPQDFSQNWSTKKDLPQDFSQNWSNKNDLPQDFSQNWSTKKDLPQDFSQNWSNKNDLPQDFSQNWSTKKDLPQDVSQNWSTKNDLPQDFNHWTA